MYPMFGGTRGIVQLSFMFSDFGVCRCWGEPHCRSFDLKHNRFQGTCTYLMTRDSCSNGFPISGSSPTLEVFADFARRDAGDSYSWVQTVIVRIYGKVCESSLTYET